MAAAPSGASDPSSYRGEDRRRVAGPVQPPLGRTYVLAAIALLCLWGVVTFGLTLPGGWSEQGQVIIQLLQVAEVMVAVAIGALALSRWYLTGDVPALWIGVALLLFGVVRLGVVELLPLVVATPGVIEFAGWLRPATQVVVALLLVRAARTVPVSTEVSGPRLAVTAVGAVAALTLVLQFVPAVANLIDGAQMTAPRNYNTVNQIGVMPGVFLLLACAFTWRGYRRRRWMFTWIGLMFAAIALGDVARVLASPPITAGLLAKETLRLAGLFAGLNGGVREILYTYRDSSTRLAKSEYTVLTAQERIREGQAAAEERAHEARSALAAIEGATRTLEHYRDRLPADTQRALSTAVSGEIRRLQRLVSVGEAFGQPAAFSLAESLAPIAASERARGATVNVDVAGDLDVFGQAPAVEQVIQSLFDNARRYAPDSPIDVSARREGELVVLRVEDRGPGVDPDQRDAIFRRGVRGDAALDVPGSGLGLYVAAKLVQEQRGELWVDGRHGGGAMFALALPAAASGTQQAMDGLEENGEVADAGGFRSTRHRE